MADQLVIGSMFSGVEGMGLGVIAATGGRIAWHCEVDQHASAVLARHFDAPNLGDVRTVDWSTVEPVDLLIGGPPCQAVSQAGRRLGVADERWLWPEAFRAMAELRPRWVLWENPLGLLTGRQDDDDEGDDGGADRGSDGWPVGGAAVDAGWFGLVLGEMADLGFVGSWRCLRSSDVGAPHRRGRVFLAAADAPHDRLDGGREARRRGTRPVDGGHTAADTDSVRSQGQPERDGEPLQPRTRPAPRDDAHRRGIAAADPDGAGLEGREPARRHDVSAGRCAVDWGRYAAAVERWERLHGPAPAPVDERGRLNPELPVWMMGYPAGWLDGLRRTAALRCAGNGCQPQVAELATRLLLPDLAVRSDR